MLHVSTKICKTSSLNFPQFFLCKTFSPKRISKILEVRLFSLLGMKRFTLLLMVCNATSTSLPKWFVFRRHVSEIFFLNEQVQIFWYERTLTNRYCKTGVRERTLLRSCFVKACSLTWEWFGIYRVCFVSTSQMLFGSNYFHSKNLFLMLLFPMSYCGKIFPYCLLYFYSFDTDGVKLGDKFREMHVAMVLVRFHVIVQEICGLTDQTD